MVQSPFLDFGAGFPCTFASRHGLTCRNVERLSRKTAGLCVAWLLPIQPGKGVLLREWAADAWREERGVLLTQAKARCNTLTSRARGFSVCRDDGWRTWSLLWLGSSRESREIQFLVNVFRKSSESARLNKVLRRRVTCFIRRMISAQESHWEMDPFVCGSQPTYSQHVQLNRCQASQRHQIRNRTVAWIRIHGVVGVSWVPIAHQLHIARSGVQRRCVVLFATCLKSGQC